MTAAERLYQLIQALSDSQINEVLHFAEFLQQKKLTTPNPRLFPPVPSPDSGVLPNALIQPLAIANCKQNTQTI